MIRGNYITIFLLVSSFFVPQHGSAEINISEMPVEAFKTIEQRSVAVFEPLEETITNAIRFELINGVPVNPQDFPAIFRMTTGGTCTATLIGPSSILLAAHCIDRNFQEIAFVSSGRRIRGICERAPGYFNDDSEDWALCLLQYAIENIPYESVDIKREIQNDDIVGLTGYGCVKPDGEVDGVLRWGPSRAVNKPTDWDEESSTIYTMSDFSGGVEAVLCPGDSGGPAFRFSGGIDDKRSVVGVNSRTTYEFGVSLLSATASTAGKTFIQDWAEQYQQEICGVNKRAGCR